jgi:hypothetical protein
MWYYEIWKVLQLTSNYTTSPKNYLRRLQNQRWNLGEEESQLVSIFYPCIWMLLCNVCQHIETRWFTHIILILWAFQQHNQKKNVHICGNLHSDNECEPLNLKEVYCDFHYSDVRKGKNIIKWSKYMFMIV